MLSISDLITSAAGAVDYYTNKAQELPIGERKIGSAMPPKRQERSKSVNKSGGT
jgi:hypothetical protein